MKKKIGFLIIVLFFDVISQFQVSIIRTSATNLPASPPLSLNEISIRDPNILYFNDTYYMTGTTSGNGFLGYSSKDLVNWTSHGLIYERNVSNWWAKYQFWAPEMVYRNGLFYLFFSGKNDTTRRATGVAVASNPLGPYIDLMPNPLTPPQYECLDGHLFRDTDGLEYFIYVYEWVQAGIGEMWIQRIASNYTHLIGEPVFLFRGTDASWGNFVVDGPSMIKRNDTYFLFWSTYNQKNDGKYCCGYATATNITGPYTQSTEPLINNDAGHCTIFKQNGSDDYSITFHQPNSRIERAQIRSLLWNEKKQGWMLDPADPVPFWTEDRLNVLYWMLGISGSLILLSVGIVLGYWLHKRRG